jgi:UDP-N-acetylmuramyl pentapeptide phosphotransferase/UDP-N-acetylglucosamine-1-phosphate transferase
MNPAILSGIAAALAVAMLLVPVRVLLGRAGIIDRPNQRSSHAVPTVRGGGVVVVAIVTTPLGWYSACGITPLWAVLVSFVVLAAISFVDDIRGLQVGTRFGAQLLCAMACIAVISSCTPRISGVLFCGMASVIAGLWIVGYTNAFNFMDGINGIAGMQAALTGAGTALIASQVGFSTASPAVVLSYVVTGAALGFLPHNFPKARAFMGDVGSAPLGFLLSLLAVWIAAETKPWVLLWIALLHANFVLDTGITFARRALRGEKVWDAHREHFYQRLVRAGCSHTAVTLLEGGVQLIIVAALVLTTNASTAIRVSIGCCVIGVWILFFGFAEWMFRRSAAAL